MQDSRGKKKIQHIFVDVLCLESGLQILKSDYKNIVTIYFCQKSGFGLGDLIKKYLEFKTGARIVSLNNTNLSEIRCNGMNAYEKIQYKIRSILNDISDSWLNLKFVQDELVGKSLNKYKLRSYLEQKGYWYLYRAIEIMTIAEAGCSHTYLAYLVNTPLSSYISQEYKERCFFYTNRISKYMPVTKREAYSYDSKNAKIFHNIDRDGRFIISVQWLYYILRSIISIFCISKTKTHNNQKPTNFIGVEQVSLYVRKNEYHDLFWMRSGYVKAESVINIEDHDQDKDSIKVLKDYGVHRVRINPSVPMLFKSLKGKLIRSKNEEIDLIIVKLQFFFSRMVLNVFFKNYTTNSNEESWVANELRMFLWREAYWKNIYSQLGIKILWSMRDVAEDSLCRSQAIESLGGYYAGSHWSLYPIDMIPTQKMYDIFFVWGRYFSTEILKRNNVPGTFYIEAGYPADFYFSDYVSQAEKLRSKYINKYVLTYIDNNSGNDYQSSRSMQSDIVTMLVDLLKEYDVLQLLYKPKRRHELEILIQDIPDLQKLIDENRFVVYLADEHGRRCASALLGMASDFVIGLGVNTAAAECYFAGADVIHANLAGFKGGSFISKGKGKFIFENIETIKNEIVLRIAGKKNFTKNEKNRIREIYSDLDPYIDGQSNLRIALILSEILRLLNSGIVRTNMDSYITEFILSIKNKKFIETSS